MNESCFLCGPIHTSLLDSLRLKFHQVASHGVVPASRIESCWPAVQSPCSMGANAIMLREAKGSPMLYLHVSDSCQLCVFFVHLSCHRHRASRRKCTSKVLVALRTLASFNHVSIVAVPIGGNVLQERGTNVTRQRMPVPGKRERERARASAPGVLNSPLKPGRRRERER